ncbi:MAG: HlyD family type I secretion periplasmic adaptor subunit [Geminicoccaceae bacterium]
MVDTPQEQNTGKHLPATEEAGHPPSIAQRTGMYAQQGRSYRVVSYQAAPKKPPIRWLLLAGLVIGLTFFAGFGSWAALAPLAGGSIAHGLLVVESSNQEINHQEGGIIKEILVRNGSRVKKNDVLLRLEPIRSKLQADALDQELIAAQASSARLQAHIAETETLVFSEEIEARRGEPEVDGILATQERLFSSAINNIKEHTEILNRKVEQYHRQIDGFRQQIAAADRQLEISKEELDGLQKLYDDDLLTASQLAARKRAVAEIEGNRGVAVAAIAQAEEAMQSAEIERGLLLTRFAEENARELETVRSRIVELKSNLKSTEEILVRTDITSPVSGSVTDMRVFTVGSTIAPGAPLMRIVPDNERLIVEINIEPLDIDVVYPGLPAEVRLSAYKQRTTPSVPGILEEISADLVADPRSHRAFYKGRVILDETEAAKFKLYPGMPADVMIKEGEHTLLDYVLSPLEQSFHRAFVEN